MRESAFSRFRPPWAANDSPRDAALELERTEWGDHRDRPAAVAHGTHCLVPGLTTDAIEEQVDAAGDYGQDPFDPVGVVVVEGFAGAQAPQVLMVGWTGHAYGAGAHGRHDLNGAAHASRCGRDGTVSLACSNPRSIRPS